MLLCTHQQEGKHLSGVTRGLSVHGNQAEPLTNHHGSQGLTVLVYRGGVGKFNVPEGQRE